MSRGKKKPATGSVAGGMEDVLLGFLWATGGSKPPLAQVGDQLGVKFPDIEAGNIPTVQVHGIGVGDAVPEIVFQEGVIGTPAEGFLAHQAVIGAVEDLDETGDGAPGEFAPGGPVDLPVHPLRAWA